MNIYFEIETSGSTPMYSRLTALRVVLFGCTAESCSVYSINIDDLSQEKAALQKLSQLAQGASALTCPDEASLSYLRGCYEEYSMDYPFTDMYKVTEVDISPITERFGEPESIECELKHFFDDFKSYYYLPAEDEAIHKSVAQFVDTSARQKATRENAYTKRTGIFFPAPAKCKKNLFKKSCYDKEAYILREDAGPEVYLHHAAMSSG